MHTHKIKRLKNNVASSLLIGVFVAALFFCFGLSFDIAHAQPIDAPQIETDVYGLTPVDDTIALGGGDIRVIAAKIIRAVLSLLGIMTVGLMIYGGYLIMTSGGDQGKIANGRKVLINTVIGLIIILSSLALVQFVLGKLQQAVTGQYGGGNVQGVEIDTFFGSGSLGRVVRDHYPFRDQTGVKRNTKVIVTFTEPVEAGSIIEDTNGNGVLGDCLEVNELDWARDCDHLKTNAVRIYRAEDENETPIEAAALTTFEGEAGDALTFVFRPFEFLGDNVANVDYIVDLTGNILKKQNEDGDVISIFDGQRSGRYFWQFQTDTTFDFAPPEVRSVFPTNGARVARNAIIQINFNEPMDPIAVQGMVNDGANPFTNIIFNSTGVEGEWRITNAYQTVEFVSNEACGQNSCGEVMYCLPLACEEDDEGCTQTYETLARTAISQPGTFEALPFTGVADVAGNALDTSLVDNRFGRGDGERQLPATPNDPQVIGDDERVPDNYLWNFTVENRIDRVAPYVAQVTPPLDGGDIPEDADLTILFSSPMWGQSFRGIQVEEYPANVDDVDDLWYRARLIGGRSSNEVTLDHRVFGPNGRDLYYFTSVSSSVRNVYQNCIYPGRGPEPPENRDDQGEYSNECQYEENEQGEVIRNVQCINVSGANPSEDTGCAQTIDESHQLKPNAAACQTYMRTISPTNL